LRLKTNIFLWVSLATVLPLTVLVLGATGHSERLYRGELTREIHAGLDGIVAEMDRRLHFDRGVVRALAEAPAMRAYVPVLEHAALGERHPRFDEHTAELNEFFEAFQRIVPSLATIRVLDASGNTLVKVSNARRSRTLYEGIERFPYAEEELHDPAFLSRLGQMPPDEVAFTLLPQTYEEQGRVDNLPMLDAVVPLGSWGHVTGYLAVTLGGDPIDRILDLAPRLHSGKLLIAELNLEQRERDGVILYDDVAALHFADAKGLPLRLRDIAGGRLAGAVHRQPQGMVVSPEDATEVYYQEYLPYPSQLVSWVVATRIDTAEIAAPFNRIRRGIWLFAAVALVLSVLVASAGARRLCGPVTTLARGLKDYADGSRDLRVHTGGAEELRQLQASFNYMADTLERARRERDRAQSLMLQNAKLASVGKMAAGIGHEINNPLSNILSLAKLIERALPEGEEGLRRDLGSLREEALRASRIVKAVLNFARQVPLQPVRFEAGHWLTETLELVRSAAQARAVSLQHSAPAGCILEGDRGQLQQVLVNLLLNAVDASPPGGRVVVEIAERDAERAICVRDRGSGIPAEILDQVFDPFFSTKPVGAGSGLGLSISLGIVERHGGRLSIENNPDGGATATIVLPRTAERPAPIAASAPAATDADA
jgi:two-component system, NtrC family, sensor kinase